MYFCIEHYKYCVQLDKTVREKTLYDKYLEGAVYHYKPGLDTQWIDVRRKFM